MRLVSVEIRDYRSIFVDEAGQALRLDLGPGANTFVGPNNCGKSNVLRAVSLALDPHHPFDPNGDTPGPRRFAYPIITLGFTGDRAQPSEAAVLEAAAAYEVGMGVPGGQTRAERGELVLQVSFVPATHRVERVETLLIDRNVAAPRDGDTQQLLDNALARLRDAVRFVLISSGESIESVLEGNFREILHSVVRDRLRREFDTAERSRKDYIRGLQESLLRPLRDRLAADVAGIFPEIGDLRLSPEVSSIDRTLSKVDLTLQDVVTTPLAGKGTGVRGGVLVAMLSYLALNATRSMVFAVEEPEAFLHPAAQEDLRDHLEQVASASGVTLLVTTHSPFTVSRSAAGRVFCLAKDREGRTRVAEAAAGDADHSPLVGGLFRDAAIESLLSTASPVPDGTAAVVLVEGDGDRFCLRLTANLIGRTDLVDDLWIKPTAGTTKLIAQAILTRAAVDSLPLVVVVDNDEAGRHARKTLTGNTFGFAGKKVFTYAEIFDDQRWKQFPVEAEDLFDPDLIQGFVDTHGMSVIEGSRKRPDDAFHYDLDQSAKETLQAWLTEQTRPEHVTRWIELLLLIRARAGLPTPAESASQLIDVAPIRPSPSADRQEGRVLVVTGQHDYARYLTSGALILPSGQPLPDRATHVGFYTRGIQPHLAAITADLPNLMFSAATASQLRATGKPAEVRAADLIDNAVRTEASLADASHHVLLLSGPDDEDTIVLEHPVQNTKRLAGKPVAWTVGPKLVPLAALRSSPATTDELDAMLEQLTSDQGGTEL